MIIWGRQMLTFSRCMLSYVLTAERSSALEETLCGDTICGTYGTEPSFDDDNRPPDAKTLGRYVPYSPIRMQPSVCVSMCVRSPSAREAYRNSSLSCTSSSVSGETLCGQKQGGMDSFAYDCNVPARRRTHSRAAIVVCRSHPFHPQLSWRCK